MHVLVICDDYYHPARVIREGLVPLEGHGYEFDWIEDAGDWSAEKLADYPLVLFAKSNNVSAANRDPWVTDEVQQAFVNYVQQGHGLLAVHSGTVYRENPVMRGLLGGVFVQHPKQCDVSVGPNAERGALAPDVPFALPAEPFVVRDEHYHMELDDRQADVFLTTTSEHSTQPGGWTRAEGAGRVCVLTPGHNVEVWLHPSFQELLKGAMGWCTREQA